jgi:hypothetical protein
MKVGSDGGILLVWRQKSSSWFQPIDGDGQHRIFTAEQEDLVCRLEDSRLLIRIGRNGLLKRDSQCKHNQPTTTAR